MFIYQFTCCYGTGYIGLVKHALGKGISGHYTTWVSKVEWKSINNSILEHTANLGHTK